MDAYRVAHPPLLGDMTNLGSSGIRVGLSKPRLEVKAAEMEVDRSAGTVSAAVSAGHSLDALDLRVDRFRSSIATPEPIVAGLAQLAVLSLAYIVDCRVQV